MAYLYQEKVLTVNADSTEFCPLQDFAHLLAVGTYELDESTQTRHGLLHLYTLSGEGHAKADLANKTVGDIGRWQLQEMHTLPISGIFDMRWQNTHPACLLAACADGSLHMLALEQSDSSFHLTEQQKVMVSEGAMALSVDIAPSGNQFVVSSSPGAISALQVVWSMNL